MGGREGGITETSFHMKPIVLRADARADLLEIQSWYESEKEGLGSVFLSSVTAKLTSIQENPRLYPKSSQNTRRALLGTFPYAVLYFDERDEIVVFAVWHTSREPDSWQERI